MPLKRSLGRQRWFSLFLFILTPGQWQGWQWNERLSKGGPVVRITVRRVNEDDSNWRYAIRLTSIEGLDQTIEFRSGQALGRSDVNLVDLNADGFLDLMVAGGKDHRGRAWFKTWVYDSTVRAFKWIGS